MKSEGFCEFKKLAASVDRKGRLSPKSDRFGTIARVRFCRLDVFYCDHEVPKAAARSCAAKAHFVRTADLEAVYWAILPNQNHQMTASSPFGRSLQQERMSATGIANGAIWASYPCIFAPLVILSTIFLSARSAMPTVLASSGPCSAKTARLASSCPVANISSM